MPHSKGTGDNPYNGQDARPQRPAPRHTTTFEGYENHGYHAQDHSVINIRGPQTWNNGPSQDHPRFRDEITRRSPDLYEGSNSPPRNPVSKRRRGNRSPRRDESESDDDAHRRRAARHDSFHIPETSAPRRSPSSPNHPEATRSPTVVNNAAAQTASVLQPLKTTLAGTPIPNSLHDNSDETVFSVCRNGKAEALYKIIQTEIRYDKDEAGVPYSILGFRLERGEDKKRCLEVKLTGAFTRNNRYKNVIVKHLHHVPSTEPRLAELQIQKTLAGQGQIQVGFNGKPVALITISGLKSTQYTVTKRQRIDSRFNDLQAEGTFSLTLALDDGAENDSDLSVVESAFFCIVLRLDEERQPMQLNLKADVKYASASHWAFLGSKSKVVSNSYTNGYSGRDSHDIIKN